LQTRKNSVKFGKWEYLLETLPDSQIFVEDLSMAYPNVRFAVS